MSDKEIYYDVKDYVGTITINPSNGPNPARRNETAVHEARGGPVAGLALRYAILDTG